MNQQDPPGWGDDSISQFLALAQQSSYATFANFREDFQALVHIKSLFEQGLTSLQPVGKDRRFLALLMLKTQGSFLGASRIVVSTQVPEAMAVVRASLESALYAFHVSHDKREEREESWLMRGTSDEARRAARKEFGSPSKIIETLETADAKLGAEVKVMYEKLIDFGAHPNVGSVLPYQEVTERDDTPFQVYNVLISDPYLIRNGIRIVAKAGLLAFLIFEHIFHQRFQIAGVDMAVRQVRNYLASLPPIPVTSNETGR